MSYIWINIDQDDGLVLLTHITWSNFDILRPEQNGQDFADNIFKCIFLNRDLL